MIYNIICRWAFNLYRVYIFRLLQNNRLKKKKTKKIYLINNILLTILYIFGLIDWYFYDHLITNTCTPNNIKYIIKHFTN